MEDIDRKQRGMLEELERVTGEYAMWVKFGALDFNREIAPTLREMEKYQKQFEFVQAKVKDIERLPDSRKVGVCFMVSLIPLKKTLDGICRHFEDALIVSLKQDIHQSIQAVSSFIENGLSVLNRQPNDVLELAQFKQSCDLLKTEMKAHGARFSEIERKNNLLIKNLSTLIFQSQYTSSDREAVDLTDIQQKWDFFQHSLLLVDDMMGQQRDVLRQNVDKKVVAFQQEVTKFNSRWQALKPKNVGEDLDPLTAHQITS